MSVFTHGGIRLFDLRRSDLVRSALGARVGRRAAGPGRLDALGLLACAVLFALGGVGCADDEGVYIAPCTPSDPTPYPFDLPAHLPAFDVPAYNPTTVEGVELGRRLYYDTMLSRGGPLEGMACASCHVQATNFANNTPGVSVLPHVNLNWTEDFLWNGKVQGGLEEVMLFEVEEFFKANVKLFRADPAYQALACEAFGTSEVDAELMARAMSQWLRTLVSADSRYDRYLQGEEELTEQELRGKVVYETSGDCASCHTLPLTTDNEFHNNGVVGFVPTTEFDLGRFVVTGEMEDRRVFKTPSLRNVELTGPYMHDGRFQTLEAVVEHYNSGVYATSTLDPIMTQNGEEYGYELNLSEEDKAALVAFLKTFTDTTITTSAEYANPFHYH